MLTLSNSPLKLLCAVSNGRCIFHIAFANLGKAKKWPPEVTLPEEMAPNCKSVRLNGPMGSSMAWPGPKTMFRG